MIANKMAVLAAAAVAACVVSSASAMPLPPAFAVLTPPEPDPVGGAVVFTTGPQAITSPTFTGTLISTVLVGDASSPFGLNALTFTYQIFNNPNSMHSMDRFTVDSFAGFLTDVSFQAPSLGMAPTSTDRSVAGDVIGYSFTSVPLGLGVIAPGLPSALLVVQTDAVSWANTMAYLIDGSIASVPSVAPVPGVGVPEPASLSLAALGAVALLRRRRRPVL